MLRKIKISSMFFVLVVLSNFAFAGTLPLNTGYDYSNYNVYPFGLNDDYWIRLESNPTMAIGPSWAVATGTSVWSPGLIGTAGIPSTWINAFGNTNVSPNGASAQTPSYAIFRKCFCLPQGFKEARIEAKVRSDESIQIWLNLMLNQILNPSPINLNNAPYSINYSNQQSFREGRNCVYVLVEDTGVHTGFNLAGTISANGVTPFIAKGPEMLFDTCSCNQRGINPTEKSKLDLAEKEVVKQIVKFAEMKRIERIRLNNPKN